MGVLEAVRGWDAYHGVEPDPVVNQAGIDPLATEAEILEAQANLYATEDSSVPVTSEEAETTEEPKEDEWTTAKLDELAKVDHVALMLEHARHMGESDGRKEEAHNLRRSCCLRLGQSLLTEFISAYFPKLRPIFYSPIIRRIEG